MLGDAPLLHHIGEGIEEILLDLVVMIQRQPLLLQIAAHGLVEAVGQFSGSQRWRLTGQWLRLQGGVLQPFLKALEIGEHQITNIRIPLGGWWIEPRLKGTAMVLPSGSADLDSAAMATHANGTMAEP